MELTDERLKKALEAGNILVTDKTLARLSSWVAKMGGTATFLSAEEIGTGDPLYDLREGLSELYEALQSTVRLLTRDDCWLTLFLFNEGSDVPSLIERQRLIAQQCALLNTAEASLKRLQGVKKRRGAPKHKSTVFLYLVRFVYGELTGTCDPAIKEPLYRFAKAFAELIDAAGVVPEDFNTFRGRFR